MLAVLCLSLISGNFWLVVLVVVVVNLPFYFVCVCVCMHVPAAAAALWVVSRERRLD